MKDTNSLLKDDRLKSILDFIPDALFLVEKSGDILHANVRAEELFGFSLAEFHQMTVEQLIPDALRIAHVEKRTQFMQQPAIQTAGIERLIYALRKDGSQFPIEVSLSYQEVFTHEQVVLCTIRDASLRVFIEKQAEVQHNLARLASEDLTEEALWKACIEAGMRVSGMDSGGIYRFNETDGSLRLLYALGLGEAFVDAIRSFPADSEIAQITLNGQPVMLPAANGHSREINALDKVVSACAIPLLHIKKTIGCLVVASHSISGMPDYVLRGLESVGSEIAHLLTFHSTARSLQASRRQLKLALDAAQLASWKWDVVSNCITLSPEAVRIFHYDFTSCSMEKILTFFHPDDQNLFSMNLKSALTRDQILNTEYRLFDGFGSLHWIVIYGHADYDDSGKPTAYIGLIQDVTERKHTEEQRREADERYKLLYETTAQGVVFQDSDGLILHANPAAERILGLNLKQLTGRDSIDPRWHAIHEDGSAYPGEDHPAMVSLRTGKPVSNVIMGIYNSAENSYRWINVNAVPRFLPGSDKVYQVYTSFDDMTERKKNEAELRISEARFGTVFRSSPNPIAISRISDNVLIDVNSAWENLTGWSRDEVIGRTAHELNTWVDPSERERLKQFVFEKGSVQAYEMQMKSRIGNIYHLLMSGEQIYLQGEACLLTMSQDITERKQAELNLALMERRYRAMIENAPDGIVLIGADNHFKYISPSVGRMFGYSWEDAQNSNPNEYTHPDDLLRVVTELQKLILDPDYIPTLQYRFKHKHGEWRWIESTFSNLLAYPGLEAIIINFRDIHERKLAEEALNHSQALLAEAQQIGRIGYMEWQAGSTNLICSPDIYTLLDLSPDTPITQAVVAGMVDPEERAKMRQIDSNLMQAQKDLDYEYRITTLAGNERWIHQIGKITYSESGVPVRMMIIIQDITERKQAEMAVRASEEKYRLLSEELEKHVQLRTAELSESRDQLRMANTALEQAARMKDEFLASMSHELRTPLTGILGLSEALQLETYGILSEKQARAVRTIEDSGRHLLDLINDILDLSKIEAGRLDLSIEPVPLGTICQAALQLTRGMSQKKHHTVFYSAPDDGVVVYGDARRLKQMLVNLLSNAIKFSPAGSSIGLEMRPDETKRQVELTVWDKGIGISPENLNRLFQPFVTFQNSLNRQYEGSGLGLSLVKHMAELHGGSIQVDSVLGEGSRFTIYLPWAVSLTQDVVNPSVAAESLKRALLVEDEEIDSGQMARYLHILGIESHTVRQGSEVLEAVLNYNPGVILLDLQLPDVDGLEVLAEIKADPRTQNIPILICSVYEQISQAMELGAVGYMVKPISFPVLRDQLDRIAARTAPVPNRDFAPRIIVADDNDTFILVVSSFLESQGYQVEEVHNGAELLEVAEMLRPDLILLDVQMPGVDGFEAAQRIRASTNRQLAEVPIIILTALAMKGDMERSLEAGADWYISKPVSLVDLADKIQSVLEKHAAKTDSINPSIAALPE